MESGASVESTFRDDVERRVRSYMAMSEQARKVAQLVVGNDLREGYFKVAREWEQLAHDIAFVASDHGLHDQSHH